MLLKEIFYKRKNEKAWSLRLLPLVFLSCFVCSVQSFAQSSVIATEQSSAITTEKEDSFDIVLLKILIEKGRIDKALTLMSNVISQPNWQEHSDYPELLKAIIEKGDNKILKSIVRVIPQSYWNKHPELLKAIIEKGDNHVLMEIVEHVSFDPRKKEHPKLVKALIANVNENFGTGFFDSYEHGVQKASEVLMEIALVILVEPHWQAHPDLKDSLIEKVAGVITSEDEKAFKNKIRW